MARTVRIVDTTLRDGHQCLWATRMPTAMMLPVADAFDRAGFWVVEMIGAVQFDACMRFIGEKSVGAHPGTPASNLPASPDHHAQQLRTKFRSPARRYQ